MQGLDTFTKEQLLIQKDLFFGWGVEDIAHRLDMDIEEVRGEVDRLRKNGELNEVLGK